MRHVYTAELARLRWTVVNCRTGVLVAAFAQPQDACALRDAGPRGANGQHLYVVGEQDPKITKPRSERSHRRPEPRQRRRLFDGHDCDRALSTDHDLIAACSQCGTEYA